MRRSLFLLAIALPALTLPVEAAQRRVLLADFDRFEIDGAYDVEVATGRLAPAIVSGTSQAIERVRVELRGRTLVIRPVAGQSRSTMSAGPVLIRVSTGKVRSVAASGAARVSVESMTAPKTDISLGGAVLFNVGQLKTDDLTLSFEGSGQAKVTGRSTKAVLFFRGSGAIDARALSIDDLELSAEGSGKVSIAAVKTARVEALGTAEVTVEGTAKCTVRSGGLGIVVCGP